ncbi:ankyrin repeat domain-containing protein [Marinobacter halodurans]|uniref:Ankyrin repeat domain-containing protein n=1 Tax=Marinobacter halodurans TaxID=2528979 RepID=A0ABY1ZLU5_9GAMM|nr:ankyrin repeat domain-containing protein [Marinobacter halodurans]TBW55503.1 ankyrin repeat domain-containing protein [Marinobacter halodurans]
MPKRPLACLVLALIALSACSGQPQPVNLETVHRANQSSPLVNAAMRGDLAAVQAQVAAGASLNQISADGTPLTAAAGAGHDRVAWYLLQQGADPNLADARGRTPLVAASAEGSQRLVKLMLSAGARVNASGADGTTAVAAAAEAGNLSVMRTLLDAGGNVNIAHDGESLLMHVVRNGDLLMTEVLIAAGADVGYRASDGDTALAVARRHNLDDIEMLLVQAGAR